MNRSTFFRRAALSGLAGTVLVALGSTPAMAHVTITPSTTAAGDTAVLRVEIPHGCDGSATTAITIRMPEAVADVTASGTDRWAADQAPDRLTYTTDEPLPDGEHAEVEFSVRLPDEVGTTLVFPVVQQCEEGEAAWTEVAEHEAGHAEHEGSHDEGGEALDRPAPVVVVTADQAGETGETGAVTAEAGVTTAEAGEAGVTTATEERDPLLTYGAAGVLVAGGLAGGAVLLRRRRNR